MVSNAKEWVRSLLDDPNYNLVVSTELYGNAIQATFTKRLSPEERKKNLQRRAEKLKEDLDMTRKELEELP